MAQYSKYYENFLAQEKTNFEVVMIADRYGNVNEGTGGTATDAFGRLRTSAPYTLFDSHHRYEDNGKWATFTATGGSVSHDPTQSTIQMNVTSSPGSKVYRETKRVFSYQPGKSLFNLNSFVFATPVSGLRQRVGFFSTNNGVFLENDGTGNFLVLRTSISGAPVDTNKVAQANWNVDSFDGTGPSGVTLDVAKANLMWMDIEWLGVGDVRFGFVVDGRFHIAHIFHNTNRLTSVYMTTATLPLRYEIENVSASGSHTMKQICSTMMSEGGYEKKTTRKVFIRPTAVSASTTAFTPIAAYRLNSGRLDGVVMTDAFQLFSTGAADFEIALILNPTTLSNGGTLTWTQQGNIDYCVDASVMTGGTITYHAYLSSTNQAGGAVTNTAEYNWDTQLGRNSFTSTSDVVVLAAKSLESNDQLIRGSLSYWDLT
jgi:hypothetical protein